MNIPVPTSTEGSMRSEYPRYCLQDVLAQYSGQKDGVGLYRIWHDTTFKAWHIIYRLDQTGPWFLTVLIKDGDSFPSKFSLDMEFADDLHYWFTDEAGLRKSLWQEGDENLYLHKVMTRYGNQKGAWELRWAVRPFATEIYFFPDYDDLD